MNKIYKVIWSKVKHCYVVVSELAKSSGKTTVKSKVGRASLAAVMAAAVLTGTTVDMNTAWADAAVDTNTTQTEKIGSVSQDNYIAIKYVAPARGNYESDASYKAKVDDYEQSLKEKGYEATEVDLDGGGTETYWVQKGYVVYARRADPVIGYEAKAAIYKIIGTPQGNFNPVATIQVTNAETATTTVLNSKLDEVAVDSYGAITNAGGVLAPRTWHYVLNKGTIEQLVLYGDGEKVVGGNVVNAGTVPFSDYFVPVSTTDKSTALTYVAASNSYLYNGQTVDSNSVYYLTDEEGKNGQAGVFVVDGQVYNGMVYGNNNEILLTGQTDENGITSLKTYWGAKIEDDNMTIADSKMTLGNLKESFSILEQNDQKLSLADIKEITLGTADNGGTIGLLYNDGTTAVPGTITMTSGGGDGTDTFVTVSNDAGSFNLATGSKVEANSENATQTLNTISINGTSYSLAGRLSIADIGTGYPLERDEKGNVTKYDERDRHGWTLADTTDPKKLFKDTTLVAGEVGKDIFVDGSEGDDEDIPAKRDLIISDTAGNDVILKDVARNSDMLRVAEDVTTLTNTVDTGWDAQINGATAKTVNPKNKTLNFVAKDGGNVTIEKGANGEIVFSATDTDTNTYTTGVTVDKANNNVNFVRNDDQSYGVNFTAGGGTYNSTTKKYEDTFVQIGDADADADANVIKLNTGSIVKGTGVTKPNYPEGKQALSGLTINGEEFLVPVIHANTGTNNEAPYLTSIELNGTTYNIVSQGASTDYSIVGEKVTTDEGIITHDGAYSVEGNTIKLNLIDNLTQQVTEDAIIINDVASTADINSIKKNYVQNITKNDDDNTITITQQVTDKDGTKTNTFTFTDTNTYVTDVTQSISPYTKNLDSTEADSSGIIKTTVSQNDKEAITSTVDISDYVGAKITNEAANATYDSTNNTSGTIGGAITTNTTNITNIQNTYVSDITQNGDTWVVTQDNNNTDVTIKDTYVTDVSNSFNDGVLTTTISQNQDKAAVVSDEIDIKAWADQNYAAKTVTVGGNTVDTTTQVVNNYNDINTINTNIGDMTTLNVTNTNNIVDALNTTYAEARKKSEVASADTNIVVTSTTAGNITTYTVKGTDTIATGEVTFDSKGNIVLQHVDANGNAIDGVTTTLTGIASKSDLTALDTRVDTIEGNITNINTSITNIQNNNVTNITEVNDHEWTVTQNINGVSTPVTIQDTTLQSSTNGLGFNNGKISLTVVDTDGNSVTGEADITTFVGDKIKTEAAKAQYDTNATYGNNTIGNTLNRIEDTYLSGITQTTQTTQANTDHNKWTVTVGNTNNTVTITDTVNDTLTNAWGTTTADQDKITLTLTDTAGHEVATTLTNVAKATDVDNLTTVIGAGTTQELSNQYSTTNYIKNATTLVNADTILDQEIKNINKNNVTKIEHDSTKNEWHVTQTIDDTATPVTITDTVTTVSADANSNITITPTIDDTNHTKHYVVDIKDDVDFRTVSTDTLNADTVGTGTIYLGTSTDYTTVKYDKQNDRINYISSDPNSSSMTTNVIATMNDGMQFAADNGQTITRKLNETLAINGDGNNISTTADTSTGAISVSLNDDINVNSVTSETVNSTTVNTETVKVGDNITIEEGNIDMGGNKITNVYEGDLYQGSMDAVNGGQLWQTNQNLNRLGDRMTKAVAGAAALAALHPLDFDPDDKLSFSAGVGNYGGSTAAAIGAFYRPNERVMFSIGGTVGNGEDMVNAGVSFALGKGGKVNASRVAAVHEINELRQQVAYLSAVVAQMAAQSGYQFTDMKPFPDTPENHWAYEYIAKLAAEGIIEGYPDGNFSGDRTMTRYEYAAMLFRALEKGFQLDKRVIDEFEPELGRLSVERIRGEQNQKEKIERVRLNNTAPDRDAYGGKINVGKNWP